MPNEPRLRILMAEVQARCGAPFVDAGRHAARGADDAPERPAPARSSAGCGPAATAATGSSTLLAGSPPGETPEEWADRAALTWCAEPEVSAARVVWLEPDRTARGRDPAELGPPGDRITHPPTRRAPARRPGPERAVRRALVPARRRRRTVAGAADRRPGAPGKPGPRCSPTARDWSDDSRRSSPRPRRGSEATRSRLRQGKLDALGEFAAGAGHELNNPLAVIVGRAQLLLARADDPEVARSLRDHPRPGPAGRTGSSAT